MTRITIFFTFAVTVILAWGIAQAHIVDGKWVDDGPDVESGYAFGAGMKAYIYRDSLMHTMRTQHNIIRQMADGEIDTDDEVFINATNAFSALITMIPHAFGPKVIIPGSRVKPGIWEHWEIFTSMVDHYKKQVDEIARVAKTEGVEAAKPLVAAIDCGYCHRPFRVQDHELATVNASNVYEVYKGGTSAGGHMYLSMGCIGCHGEGGNSKTPQMERFPMLAGRDEAYIVSQLKAFRSGARGGIIMPVVAKTLSDDQISSLAAYLSSQK